jgi:hypothetical protein
MRMVVPDSVASGPTSARSWPKSPNITGWSCDQIVTIGPMNQEKPTAPSLFFGYGFESPMRYQQTNQHELATFIWNPAQPRGFLISQACFALVKRATVRRCRDRGVRLRISRKHHAKSVCSRQDRDDVRSLLARHR